MTADRRDAEVEAVARALQPFFSAVARGDSVAAVLGAATYAALDAVRAPQIPRACPTCRGRGCHRRDGLNRVCRACDGTGQLAGEDGHVDPQGEDHEFPIAPSTSKGLEQGEDHEAVRHALDLLGELTAEHGQEDALATVRDALEHRERDA